MRTSIIAIIAGVLFSCVATAQDARFDFVDELLQPVERGEAAFRRKAVLNEDGYYHVHILFLDGKPRMTGRYCDEALQNEDGWFVYFFYAGHKESEGAYVEGDKAGTWQRWDWTGKALPDRHYKSSEGVDPALASVSAEFPGGHGALQQFIEQHLEYPKAARVGNIEGYVEVAFTISDSGEIENIQVLKSPHIYLGEAGRRLVEKMPDWQPAMKNGQTVTSNFILPMTFELSDADAMR